MSIRALTPLDGRYASLVTELADYLSEWALIKYRVLVEVEWLIEMASRPEIPDLRPLTAAEIIALRAIPEKFDDDAALRAKEIEATTRHDVKAVEYLVRERLKGTSLEDVSGWIHFCCTSEDINNLSYALMLRVPWSRSGCPQPRTSLKP